MHNSWAQEVVDRRVLLLRMLSPGASESEVRAIPPLVDADLIRRAAATLLISGAFFVFPEPIAFAQSPESEASAGNSQDAANVPPDGEPTERTGRTPGLETLVINPGSTAASAEAAVPTSALAFDTGELDALGVQDVSDLALITPNLEINTISGTTPTFFIRGVGLLDFNSNATGAVAIYQDGVPINAPALQLGQLFDSQVTVLRGPQPYGNWRNASAGAISMSPNLPTGEIGARLRGDYGTFEFRDLDGYLEAPIVSNLSTRLAFRFTERDPFVDNQCGALPEPTRGACGANPGSSFLPRFVPAGLPTEVNGESRWSARGLLRFQPDDYDMDWVLNGHGGRIDQQSRLGQVIGTNPGVTTRLGYIDPAVERILEQNRLLFSDRSPVEANREASLLTLDQITEDFSLTRPFDNAYNLVGNEAMDSYGVSLNGDIGAGEASLAGVRLGDIRVKLITGADGYDRSRLADFDFSPDTLIHLDTSDNAWQFTQSIQLESDLAAIPVSWSAGGFFLGETLDSHSLFEVSFTTNGRPTNIEQVYSQDTWSAGAWASFEWSFLDAFTLAGGVRFNWEKKDFSLQVARTIGSGGGGLANTTPADDSQTWSAPTGGVSLTWDATEDVSLYAKYSRGWKSGHFNAAILENELVNQTDFVPDITFADPETLDAFEVGLSGLFWDGSLQLRGAAFFYRYDNYQVFVLQNTVGAPPQFEIINANDARIYGAELDVYSHPFEGRAPGIFEGISLEGHLGWLESEFLDFSRERTIAVGGAVLTDIIDYTGNRLPNTPRFKASGSASWEIPLGRWGFLIPRYDFTYTDDVFFDPSQGQGPPPLGTELPRRPKYGIGQRAYWLHSARITYRVPQLVEDQVGSIEISGWVRNFTDEVYKSYVADAIPGFSSLLNFVGDPRTYGLSVTFQY